MSNTYGIPIHSWVSKELSKSIRCFCDHINNSDADLFIVLAQKAICLFQILLDQNLLRSEIRTKFISSTAISAADVNHFTGKIAILDDIMITGSSVAKIANKLIYWGVPENNIQIIALARDKTYQTMQFTHLGTRESELYCAIETEDVVSISLSSQICDVLAYYGKPYDSDFWVCQKSKVTDFRLSEIMNPNLWNIYDVTDSSAKNDRDVWTLFPREPIKKRLWNLLGVNCNESIHLKVRLYVYRYPDGTYNLKFVPMAFFHEITLDDLERLHGLMITEPDEGICWTPHTRLRFLQFYIACAMYKALTNFFSGDSVDWPSITELGVLFGAKTAEYIKRCLMTMEKNVHKVHQFDPMVCTPDLLGYDQKFSADSLYRLDDHFGFELNSALLELFLWWHETHEIPSRMDVRNPFKHYITDYESIQDARRHLKQGFSLKALKEFIGTEESVFYSEELVSVFLDRAIDRGYIVPIIYENPDAASHPYICRAYRHGEDLPFGKADWVRLLYFLKQLDKHLRDMNGNQKEYIADISLHKMVVLFYQIGLKRGHLFNRFLGFANDPFLQERFCVHGIVEAIRMRADFQDTTPPYVSEEDEERSDGGAFTKFLVSKLIDMGFISKGDQSTNAIETNKIDFCLGEESDSENSKRQISNVCLSEDEIKKPIDEISKIIATWYICDCQKNSKRFFKENITALTSCVDIYVFISAIATEVYYFKQYWNKNAKEAISRIIRGDDSDQKDFFKNDAEKALYSGREKHRYFKTKRADKVISTVKGFLEEKDMSDLAETWIEWWKDLTDVGDSRLQNMKKKLLLRLYLFSACYEWLNAGGLISDSGIPLDSLVTFEEYNDDLRGEHLGELGIFEHFNRIRNICERAKSFKQCLDEKVKDSTDLIDSVVEKLAKRTSSYTIEYLSALLITIKEKDHKITDKMFRQIWEQMEENTTKTKINIIPLTMDDTECMRYGVFYEGVDDDAINILLQFYVQFYAAVCASAYPTDAILIPHLPPQAVFRHNLKRNITKYAHDFYGYCYIPIESQIAAASHIHEIKLLLTCYTKPEQAASYDVVLRNNLGSFKKTEDIKWPNIAGLGDITQYTNYIVDIPLETSCSPTVRIIYDTKTIGTGVLFRERGQVFCVTCQHLLDECRDNFDKEKLCAQLSNGEQITVFPLNYTYRKARKAAEEVLVLKLKFDTTSICDGSSFFSEATCAESHELTHQEVVCSGFSRDFRFGHNIPVKVRGYVNFGYMEGKADDKLTNGYSGAGWIDESGKLLGIHTKHSDHDSHVVLATPAHDIFNVLQFYINKEENDTYEYI